MRNFLCSAVSSTSCRGTMRRTRPVLVVTSPSSSALCWSQTAAVSSSATVPSSTTTTGWNDGTSTPHSHTSSGFSGADRRGINSADDGDHDTYHLQENYQMIPKKYTVGNKIAVRSYLDRNRTELSDRTYMPQKAWFKPYTPRLKPLDRPYQQHRYNVYDLETKLVWKAFDTPELIGIFLHDECIRGNTQVYSEAFLHKALEYTSECRYWRAIGITKPFYDEHTLRAHCWEDHGLQVGTLVLSQAMRHALMDLERAVRRQEMGLEPMYVWDRWGPAGFIDGARNDYLPRFAHNPYRDPDGVEVTELDILPYNNHELIKERYAAFIFPDTSPFEGVFSTPSHGSLTLGDVPSAEARALYLRLSSSSSSSSMSSSGGARGSGGEAPVSGSSAPAPALPLEPDPSQCATLSLSPSDLRLLFHLSAHPEWLAKASAETSWDAVRAMMQEVQEVNDEKIDAARLLQNTRHHPDRVRAFFEEKCGFHDFMHTSDKTITGAVLCYLEELRRLCVETSWGADLARALTDIERAKVIGREAFLTYRHIEDAILDKKRRAWAARFAGEAKEEVTLDYLLENFGRRTSNTSNVGTTGEEFDREQEPIGRQVQRRVLDADKANKLAAVRKSRGRMWSKKKSVFDSLHQKQLQNFNYGVH